MTSIEEISRLYGELAPALRHRPDTLYAHPGVIAGLKNLGEGEARPPEMPDLFGVQVIEDGTLREREWRLFAGEELVAAFFPTEGNRGVLYRASDSALRGPVA